MSAPKNVVVSAAVALVLLPAVIFPVEVPVLNAVLKLLDALIEEFAPVTVRPPLAVCSPVDPSVVKDPAAAVVPPMAPGIAIVAPFRVAAFRLATLVVEDTANGAVPVASVLVICPVALIVLNAPVDAVVPPIGPGVVSAVAMSATTMPRKLGCAAEPVVGPANTIFAACVARVSVSVPVVVTGDPVIVKIGVVEPSANATLVTLPDPPPTALTVTLPNPFVGLSVMFVPATSCVGT
jgi:hypothetical protein